MELTKKNKKREYKYNKKQFQSSIRILKNKPGEEDVFPLDDKYDQHYMPLIKDSLFNLKSENELTRAMAMVELTKILRCGSSIFQNHFDIEDLNVILNVFACKTEKDTLLTINFLGFLTFFYNSYSDEILSNDFVNLMIGIYSIIKSDSSFSAWCTLLANLFYDVPSHEPVNESGLPGLLQDIPEDFICEEYVRLITVLCSIKKISSDISSQFIIILINFVTNDFPLEIKSTALESFRKLLKTERRSTLLYTLTPMTNIFLDILVQSDDVNIIINDLKLIRKLFCIDSNFMDLLTSIDIYSELLTVLKYDNDRIKYEAFKTVNSLIKIDNLFNAEEASMFISYDYKTELSESSFKCKIQVINLLGQLIDFLDYDLMIEHFNDEIIDLIFDILDSTDITAKITCYQFFNDLMNKIASENEIFLHIKDKLESCEAVDVAENDVLSKNEDVKELAEFFLSIFDNTSE